MIPEKEPTAKDHRPSTCLNTLYKAVTSVIDELLKEHEATHHLMQIDQKGCKRGSVGCIDNLLIDNKIHKSTRKHHLCMSTCKEVL